MLPIITHWLNFKKYFIYYALIDLAIYTIRGRAHATCSWFFPSTFRWVGFSDQTQELGCVWQASYPTEPSQTYPPVSKIVEWMQLSLNINCLGKTELIFYLQKVIFI